jgi:L-lactate dehydrogenase complex protein LldG
MGRDGREEILQKLKAAPEKKVVTRPSVPPLTELSWDDEEMIRQFTEILTEQTGVVHRVKDFGEALTKLTEIVKSEQISKIMATTDNVTTLLNLPSWGEENGVDVMLPGACKDRDAFKQAVFDEVQAGITGADYAIAEAGTLVFVHDSNQPRLVSLAPITHIAIVPLERLRPVCENATDKIFGKESEAPRPQHDRRHPGCSL